MGVSNQIAGGGEQRRYSKEAPMDIEYTDDAVGWIKHLEDNNATMHKKKHMVREDFPRPYIMAKSKSYGVVEEEMGQDKVSQRAGGNSSLPFLFPASSIPHPPPSTATHGRGDDNDKMDIEDNSVINSGSLVRPQDNKPISPHAFNRHKLRFSKAASDYMSKLSLGGSSPKDGRKKGSSTVSRRRKGYYDSDSGSSDSEFSGSGSSGDEDDFGKKSGHRHPFCNIFMASFFLYILYQIISTLRYDVSLKLQDHVAKTNQQITNCQRLYTDNRCEPLHLRVPALENSCREWKACIDQPVGTTSTWLDL
ncbi:hypothetical protein H4219_005818 [Mycoemilia scoparia]|uniref:Brl1/Brr6 domain-containing protein n=1 Tax=Mycoemilia scoparia TaxID=417184 RepID=A0A9W8DNN7_9FUNG|nr:hypothetical protein H4219_005818 [Mycoemilia scoparia]